MNGRCLYKSGRGMCFRVSCCNMQQLYRIGVHEKKILEDISRLMVLARTGKRCAKIFEVVCPARMTVYGHWWCICEPKFCADVYGDISVWTNQYGRAPCMRPKAQMTPSEAFDLCLAECRLPKANSLNIRIQLSLHPAIRKKNENVTCRVQ